VVRIEIGPDERDEGSGESERNEGDRKMGAFSLPLPIYFS